MFRVQFYPSEELTKVLGERANKAGVSVSKYVTDFLEAQLLPENPPLAAGRSPTDDF